MIKLRPLQIPFYNDIISYLDKNNKAKICCFLPTGGGKSVIIGKLVNDYLKARESHFRILVIQFIQMIGFKV